MRPPDDPIPLDPVPANSGATEVYATTHIGLQHADISSSSPFTSEMHCGLWGPWSSRFMTTFTLLASIIAGPIGIFASGSLIGVNWWRCGYRRRVFRPVAVGSVGAIVAWLSCDVTAWRPLLFSSIVAVLTGVALIYGDIRLQKGLLRHLVKSGNGPTFPWIPLAALSGILFFAIAITALNWNEDSALRHATWGEEFINNGQYLDAEAMYTRAIERDPSWPAYRLRRAEVRYQLNKLDEALKDCSDYIRLAGNTADIAAYITRAKLFLGKSEYDLAVADCNDAIRIDPTDAEAYFLRGNAHLENSEPDKAIADFSKVIQLEPSDANAYHNRGCAFEKKGQKLQAEADFAEAVRRELKPN